MTTSREVLDRGPVVPGVTVESVDDAVGVARALADGGVTTIELTLRTPVALEALAAVRDAEPRLLVGAGTVLGAEQLSEAFERGAQFAVSPGATRELLCAAQALGLPLMPGVATVSEAMAARALGFSELKLFPASSVGMAFLGSVAPVLPDLRFCPTGGISESDAARWLAYGNVAAVGGSWLVPKPAVAAKAWGAITELAARARRLR